jgi:hypothetical protein
MISSMHSCARIRRSSPTETLDTCLLVHHRERSSAHTKDAQVNINMALPNPLLNLWGIGCLLSRSGGEE